MFLLKEVAALLIFVDLRSEGNRSLFKTGAPNDNFRKIICSEDDLRSRMLGKISCLPASPRIFEHQKNGIIAHF